MATFMRVKRAILVSVIDDDGGCYEEEKAL